MDSTNTASPIHRVLIANRGEIARRIIRTLDRLGIDSVAVYSDGDAHAPHVREATFARPIGQDPASESYLRVDAIIQAAIDSGADAIHPGYGFLAESVALARACKATGVTFIGPGVRAIDVMGDKARSRDHVETASVPIVPGFNAAGMSDAEIYEQTAAIGLPVLIKPSAGGGGKGMEAVHNIDDLTSALASARRLALSAFGDDTLIVERLIEQPRHIEVQIFGDSKGHVLALGERECTLQRRHQKVIEEAPSVAINEATRQRLLDAAVLAARSVDYVGAGTVEFLIDASRPTEFYFIEMNTRLQVEHPVTELVTGVDLVEWQVRVAEGAELPEQSPAVDGVAVEARIYAETPEREFLPSVGTVLLFTPPAGARVDSAVETGSAVSSFYDPMIAKIVASGKTREAALDALDDALAQTVILGVETNIAFLRTLIADSRVRAGALHTGLIDTLLPLESIEVTDTMTAAAAAAWREHTRDIRHTPSTLWQTIEPGWRISMDPVPPPAPVFLTDDGTEHTAGQSAGEAQALADGDGNVWVSEGGATVRLRPLSRREQTLRALKGAESEAGGPDCLAPMPGAVTRVHVEQGTRVAQGDPLVAIEAMKMEHPVVAPFSGTVSLLVSVGDQVQRDQPVARVEPDEETS